VEFKKKTLRKIFCNKSNITNTTLHINIDFIESETALKHLVFYVELKTNVQPIKI